ncbi:MAG: sugar phosphate isomerase/epimerase [Ruminococcaceae bacterium]|nr:sugar phosphate isomerase/epimerase [Oscillospiraceae bacterium]
MACVGFLSSDGKFGVEKYWKLCYATHRIKRKGGDRMKFGICTGVENAALLKELGYDYIELGLSALAAMDEAAFAACRETLSASGLPAEAANVFFPASVRLTGPDADPKKIEDYVERALSRAAALGIRVVVLGSSGARNLPEGYDRECGYQEFLRALRICGDVAEKYGITVAIEPLHFPESNLINRVEEGLQAARDAAHPAVKTLADLWHMNLEGETFDVIAASGGEIAHMHIASPERFYPAAEDGTDYASFRAALSACGYDARISIEAKTEDFAEDARRALAFLKTL